MLDRANTAGNFPQLIAKAGMIQPNMESRPAYREPVLFRDNVYVTKAIDWGINARETCPMNDMFLAMDDVPDMTVTQAVRL